MLATLVVAVLSAWALAPVQAHVQGRDDGERRPPDVVLFVATGLRADTLGARGADGASLTPELDAFAARAVAFDAALTPSPGGTAALASLWTSRAPCALAEGGAPPPDVATLPERFARAGYLTVAFCDGGDVLEGTGLERGFAHFASAFRGPAHQVDEALDFVATRPPDRPYLLVVQTYGARMPYRPAAETLEPLADAAYDGPLRLAWRKAVAVEPHEKIKNPMGLVQRGYREAFAAGETSEADRAFLAALYAASAREVDRAFGRLVDYLERRGELDRTLVAVASDYGTALFEHGAFGHAELSEATLAVPLLVRMPRGGPETGPETAIGRRTDLAALADVLPTLAAACGIAAEPGDEGRDLLAAGAAEAAPAATFAELHGGAGAVAVRFERFLALVEPGDGDGAGVALYHLSDPAAPDVAPDIAGDPAREADVERARGLAREHRARCAR